MRLSLQATCLAVAALLLSGATLSGTAVQAQERVYFAVTSEPRLPACSDASVQGAVAGRVASADAIYYGGRTITGIERIAEVGYRADGISPLARRYCSGIATLSDGSRHGVHYALVEYNGFASVGWRVDACLEGLDRWHVHNGGCRTVRP
ncbi:cytoplasmic protein [Pannonibacter tanglangensis]|uniref:Cytoplasmic protein n=1 Tax=Pannonibacter tanglangensis TaxID=2750084 RepID=A0ABW9ZF14_9HYPH|nr:cytoplasmic protein [Pannonibacter sp. XCT-34]NBN63296.1 cytoplasmic protein [Pannonibacter sp. XCT-34]